MTLKIAAVIGLALTLPFIYLLGKEIANKRVGLMALLFTGIGYWPVVQSRFALRITFYPLFVAPTLYFFFRGLKRSNRNDFLLSGLFLGLGLMGYTPFRIVPIALVILFAVYLLHRHAANVRMHTTWAFGLLVVMSVVAAMPLLSYAVQNPEAFSYRAFSRLGSAEIPLSDSPIILFFGNLLNAAKMFNWYDGEIWVHSVPGRPALDVVSAVLFVFGFLGVLVRYIQKRNWIDILLLLSVPLLLLPSILSLAFPNENPALNRMVGAIVPVFILVGIAFDGLLTTLQVRFDRTWGRRAAVFVGALLIFWSASHNYDLIFNQYANGYRQNAWNTTEMGEVIKSFTVAVGSPDNVYVVPFPHWIDTRLVSMTANLTPRDYALPRERIQETQLKRGPKLFLLNLQDIDTLSLLNELYPQGVVQTYDSEVQHKDFLMYLVVPE
jgi:NADH:ubiquinone oxidoreductase subunit K